MVRNAEDKAREQVDKLLAAAGWLVCDADKVNLSSSLGVAIREFPLPGHGFADYLFYVNGKAAGVIEAKKEGATLSGVEIQSDKYTRGLPKNLPAWDYPLPFSYQSTGTETRFTNGLDPSPRSRAVFAFHRPETLAEWLEWARACQASKPVITGNSQPLFVADAPAAQRGATLLERMQFMPPLIETGLWPAQIAAIKNLEKSLKENRPRALIQMATGSGKTFTAISFIYRLIKFAGARRVLFLVDRGNLGDQTLKEFQQYASPYNNFTFTEGERRPFVQWTNAASRMPCQDGEAGAKRSQKCCARDGKAGSTEARGTTLDTPPRGSASALSRAYTPRSRATNFSPPSTPRAVVGFYRATRI